MNNRQVPNPSKPYTGGKGSGLSAPMVIGLVVVAACVIFIFQNTDEHRGQLPVLRLQRAAVGHPG